MSHTEGLLSTADQVLSLARSCGADQAEVAAARSTDFEVKVADGEIVTLTQATAKGLGLRVFVGQHMGFCTTSDFQADNLQAAVERAVAMAKEAAADPHHGLADVPRGRIDAGEDLDLYDPKVLNLSPEDKIRWAHELEAAARAADPQVTKFRDSGVASGDSESVLATSDGAQRTVRSTGISLWCNPIAEKNGELQTEVWYDSKTHVDDLSPVAEVGKIAGQRAARMLGARPIPTQKVPVIFEPHMAAGLVGGMLAAIDGDMVYKNASFLADRLNQRIAVSELNVVDDPLLPRGLGTAPFDGEGLPTRKKSIIEAGTLRTFLYDSYTARKAGAEPNASARRGYSSLPRPGVFNFRVEAGNATLEDILSSTDRALWVTRGLGSGVNPVTGNYSRGANGLWVEKGEVQFPVQEVTIAGQFLSMLQGIDAIGNDFTVRGASGAPTLRIREMTVSGA